MSIETSDTGQGQVSIASNNSDGNDIEERSKIMTNWEEDTLICRTLLKGTRGMKEAGKLFLPQQTMESNKNYQNRLSRSTLLNAFAKTCSFLSGQVFQSDVVFDESVNDIFKEWSLDIDLLGNNIDVFLKRVFFNGLAKGVSLILVDAPKKNENIKTKSDEKKENIRPFLREINPSSIIGFRTDENGKLDQVRISESILVPLGLYGTKEVNRVRVLFPGGWELHEETSSKMSIIESGKFSINQIPIIAFIPGEESSPLTGQSPLIDLAELNIKHWRTYSDQDNILSVARVPLLFGKKIDIEEGEVSSRAMILSDDDSADLKYVEITGNAISSGRDDVKDVESSMALYGLQQLVPRTGNITATEKALTSAESNSSLGTWATEFESVVNAALKMMGEFAGIEFLSSGVTVNKEYNFGIANIEELTMILKAHEQGIISAQGAFSEIRRRGTFDEHREWENNSDEMDEEGKSIPVLGTLSGSLLGTDK